MIYELYIKEASENLKRKKKDDIILGLNDKT